MPRAAIYARYSTDMQKQSSIEDQILLCTERMKANGDNLIQSYTDHAVSGASLMRPGIQMLLQDAISGKVDTVYAEALDRFSRDQEDIAGIFKRLSFAGVKIVTLSEGEINHLHIGLKGTMNALFLKDLADKTRRGLRGRVEAGKSGGGKCFGYDVVPGEDRGERVVNVVHAAIVKRIFEDYADGKSPKAIAKQLNRENVPGPSGKGWGQSTINGNRQRGTGILNNELYIGRLVWNRLRYVKDPDTGKRISKLNPEEEWVVQDVPELRIIDQDLWEKVKSRQAGLTRKPELWQTNRPRNLFAYLIKCGTCGGGCSTVSKGRIGCSNARNKGTCSNKQTIKRDMLEEAVLGSLREHLMDEELCKLFCEEYTRHLSDLNKRHNSALHLYREELAQLEKEKSALVKSILNGVPGDLLKDDAVRIDGRIKELNRKLEGVTERPALFEPGMSARYRQEVERLIDLLNSEHHRSEASDLIRSMIEAIVLTPAEDRDGPIIDLVGDLAGILSIASERGSSSIVDDLSNLNPDECEALVAGAGFEPATFRL
ncbi:recombinase family protein [Phaeobacter gallaeciensis]|uniref:recombinase family protein n=1 Tax=Phaeobacter gallaeciensis TaxID=60890 RepID=UPI00237FA3D2|nr:recombinase family protein [Phaeobacter gallaeciensis]MDE4100292.1 recombinase family protein [Phaeobacter gallaeciensis]MDE4109096.1 recombinase family protein [Phaeobacter gallaeciensis]MDE4113565.1 recombinase family protein [Phaeobacter gallaeciensis]MDE4118033.1 recombinase family protein [Phaeobacter gallaeciensis]MDE4122511.1 recombinase family protein [Phaeobacter gallaeciensis]